MSDPIGRREFAGAAMFIPFELVRGSQANSAIRLGLLGCGSRGTTVANAFVKATNTRVVALADLFQDRLDAGRKAFPSAEPNLLFRGPKAFREIAGAKDLDMILLATPDYFHPEHLDAVVAAGRHVYCEKPAAVDVAGCLRFVEIGKRAEGRLSLDVGFNVRHGPAFYEMVKRVHAGAIGKVASASTFYHATAIHYPPRPGASAVEKRIRNFYWDRVLSGDVIVDQNIHIVDLCNWVIGAHPLKATGSGGRKVRNDEGNIWDHWSLTYTYPEGVHVSFNSVQFGETFWDVGGRFLGDKGIAEAYYSGNARILGPEPWDFRAASAGAQGFSTAGNFSGLENSEQRKAKAFIESIVTGKYHNQSGMGAEAALSAILGRMAAYSGHAVSWEEMIASNQSYEGAIDLSSLE